MLAKNGNGHATHNNNNKGRQAQTQGRQIPIQIGQPVDSTRQSRSSTANIKKREMDSNHTFDGSTKPPVTANGDKPKMERPQCHTCFEDYDDEDHKPCIGNCGHSLCLECQKRIIHCPFCNQRFAFYTTTINYQLLDTISDLEKFHVVPKVPPKPKRPPTQHAPKIDEAKQDGE
ncbi:hypothetical protein WR25_04433 [Diploscapter pachys]|uniref:RING-type domain-containing protein n=1 Tax=Diploscapter pachys TaxID=2018661 RepID=A0A2A2LG18_9BILA|nr:hypothetical protein WR25_04433 [Diploscapter pachys]